MSNFRWSIPPIIVALVATLFFAQTSPSREKKQDVISQIEIQGNRRIPTDTIRTLISIRPGDTYHAAPLERDFNSLWKTGYFEEIHITRETSDKGWIIHIHVKERPAIRKTPAAVGISTGGWVPPLTTPAAQRGELGTSCLKIPIALNDRQSKRDMAWFRQSTSIPASHGV